MAFGEYLLYNHGGGATHVTVTFLALLHQEFQATRPVF